MISIIMINTYSTPLQSPEPYKVQSSSNPIVAAHIEKIDDKFRQSSLEQSQKNDTKTRASKKKSRIKSLKG